MANIEKLLEQMRREAANVRFNDLKNVCETYFGKPWQDGSSHAIFKTPWPGDPRVNIQNAKGKAKPYQVRQVLQPRKSIRRVFDPAPRLAVDLRSF
jgi:hypothetical protein